jgi:hypothetical protein
VARFPDTAWWYWAALVVLLAAVPIWPAAGPAAAAVGVVQAAHFYVREERIEALPVQVRLTFLALLLAGFSPPLAWLHWLMLAGTTARVAFDYCLLARTLALMPWNRTRPLTLPLVRVAYFTPPVAGSILAVLARA